MNMWKQEKVRKSPSSLLGIAMQLEPGNAVEGQPIIRSGESGRPRERLGSESSVFRPAWGKLRPN
jgi:hypothetical protein